MSFAKVLDGARNTRTRTNVYATMQRVVDFIHDTQEGRADWQREGSSDKCLPGSVECVDPEDEEAPVTEAVCLPLHGLDLVVRAFQWPVEMDNHTEPECHVCGAGESWQDL